MIKAIFFDLDGTLLNSDKKITEKTVRALKKCRENGIRLYVATARPPLLGKMTNLNYNEVEPFFDGGVFCNGACLCYNGKKIYSPMPREVIGEISEIADKYPGINLAAQMTEEKHSFLRDLPSGEHGIWGIDEKSVLPFDYSWKFPVIRVLVFQWDGILDDVYNEMEARVGKRVNLYLTGNRSSIEIVNNRTSKKSGVDSIVAHMNLNPDEIAIFGDDFNDVEMLKGYRFSIAMGNAHDDIKNLAGHVAPGNDEDGIYYALKDYLHLVVE